MARLVDALRHHRRVGIDTMIFIYHFEDQSPLARLATATLEEMRSNLFEGVTSTVTLTELLVRPIQLERLDIAHQYELALSRYPNLQLVELDSPCAVRAAYLRADYGLHVADAIQIATTLEHGATAFLTNDVRLRKVSELEVLMLDDFLES